QSYCVASVGSRQAESRLAGGAPARAWHDRTAVKAPEGLRLKVCRVVTEADQLPGSDRRHLLGGAVFQVRFHDQLGRDGFLARGLVTHDALVRPDPIITLAVLGNGMHG